MADRCLVDKCGLSSVEKLEEKAQKQFSLVETGILEMPHTRLLLANIWAQQNLVFPHSNGHASKRHT